MLPIISTYEMIPAETKSGAAFDNNSTNFDAWTAFLGVAEYLFADFQTSALAADLATLQLEGSEDGTNWTVLYDFGANSQIISHSTSQTQLYRVGISMTGPTRRYLKWNAVAGSGNSTAYGRATIVQQGIAPVSGSEWQGSNFVYAEIL